jgi:hypothetical protein
MSVCSVRSCASSIIITLYDARSGSPRNSRSSMPSVMYLPRRLGGGWDGWSRVLPAVGRRLGRSVGWAVGRPAGLPSPNSGPAT